MLLDHDAPPVAAERPPRSPRRAYRWLIGVAVLLALLALLGYAEVNWLHDLPQDHATRVALIALPDTNSAPLAADWPDRLMAEATDPALLAEVVADLDPHDGAQPPTPEALKESMRLGSQCIERQGEGAGQRGALLYVTVRGQGPTDTGAIADAWTERFLERSHPAFPGLTIQPAATTEVSYGFCR